MQKMMNSLQSLGRALMLPIAALPIAGLLMRLGQPDLLDVMFLAAAGQAVFENLGLLFAIGVATGYARDGNGAAALAGVICFVVAREGAETLIKVPTDVLSGATGHIADALGQAWKNKALAKVDVPVGILAGLAGGTVYNRVVDIKVPSFLAFFGGRRLAPIVCGLVGLIIALGVGLSFEVISDGVDAMSRIISSSGVVGYFLFGLLNRMLLVTGLHHILNNVAWFVVGDFHGATGDLRRFFAGDPQAGGFMSGFFPVMIFGLPAACLAMYNTALPERRKETTGLLLSLALTAALTGVTEPIEFTFMFVSPLLYAVHAFLTATAMALMNLLGVRLGFTFSAGLLDYVLSYGKASRPLVLLPVGAVYAAIYYAIFRFAIVRFDIKTPGRELLSAATKEIASGSQPRGSAFITALGGSGNIVSIGACTTRLRLVLKDSSLIDEPGLKVLGALGVIRPSANSLQVVVGPVADQVAMEMRDATDPVASPQSPHSETRYQLPAGFLEMLGSASNVLECRVFRRRLWLKLKDRSLVDEVPLGSHGLRYVDQDGEYVHMLFCADFPGVPVSS